MFFIDTVEFGFNEIEKCFKTVSIYARSVIEEKLNDFLLNTFTYVNVYKVDSVYKAH